MDDKVGKARSPQFPFIPLAKAVGRAKDFEQTYKHHTARLANALTVWGYKEKTSGGIQTVAALMAYGLMADEGSGKDRKVKLTPLANTILKDARPGKKEEALQVAALRPKIIHDLWEEWGVHRPPDPECISHLHIDRHFTEDAAARFLQIYDSTIATSGLADGDKTAYNEEASEELEAEDVERPPQTAPTLKASGTVGTVARPAPPNTETVMANERVVFAHELRPNQGFRILVTGDVDAEMVAALKAFAEFQAKLVPKKVATEHSAPYSLSADDEKPT